MTKRVNKEIRDKVKIDDIIKKKERERNGFENLLIRLKSKSKEKKELKELHF